MAGSATDHPQSESSKLAKVNGPDPHKGRASRTGLSSDTSFASEPEAQGLLLAGNECTERQDFAHAQRLYAEGLAHATGIELRGALLSNRCAVLAHADRWDDALVVALECVELRPEWPRSHWCKGSALEGVGRHGEALDAFKTALELDPENVVRLLRLLPLLAALRWLQSRRIAQQTKANLTTKQRAQLPGC